MILLLGAAGEDARALARALLARGVRETFGLEELPELARERRGKPFFPACPHIHFNLSHSGGLALCAVGDAPVGVDIEELRPRRSLERLAARALSPEELRWFRARGSGAGDFYTLWTRKEALAKYTGAGILDPRTVTPPLPGEEGTPALRSWAGEGWRAACGAEGPLPEEIRWLSGAEIGQDML